MELPDKIEGLLNSLKEILPNRDQRSGLENLIKRIYMKSSCSESIRKQMNQINETISELVTSNLIKEIEDLDYLVWGQIDDLLDKLMKLGESNEMSVKRVDFYIEKFALLKKLADKAEIELTELLRKIGLLLISLNHEVDSNE